jgi:hypothetical protein
VYNVIEIPILMSLHIAVDTSCLNLIIDNGGFESDKFHDPQTKTLILSFVFMITEGMSLAGKPKTEDSNWYFQQPGAAGITIRNIKSAFSLSCSGSSGFLASYY